MHQQVNLHRLFREGFDLVILALMLPDIDGETICSSLREISEIPIIMFTAKSSENDRVKGLGIGVDNYVVKPFSAKELVARVKTHLRRITGNRKKLLSFKNKTRSFLLISLLIAGIGSLGIALFLSRCLSKPIADLKIVAEKVAQGDFSVRTSTKAHDEVGKLSELFNKMAGSLQKEEILRKQLMSNITQELRTPLSIILIAQ